MIGGCAGADPPWGQEGREQKAEAILATLELHCGRRLRDGIWLDIGCGSGALAAKLAKQTHRVIGVDPEPWQRWEIFAEECKNLLFFVGKYQDLSTILGNTKVDVIICNQVYEHVHDPEALLSAIEGVMNESAVCYFAGPNLLWPIEPHVFWPFVHWMPRKFAQRLMSLLGSKKSTDLDANSWTYWRLTRAFRKLKIAHRSIIAERLSIEVTSHGKSYWFFRFVPKWIVTVFSPFSPGFIFVLKKSRSKISS